MIILTPVRAVGEEEPRLILTDENPELVQYKLSDVDALAMCSEILVRLAEQK